MLDVVTLLCGHAVCAACVQRLFAGDVKSVNCPSCRQTLKRKHVFVADEGDEKPRINHAFRQYIEMAAPEAYAAAQAERARRAQELDAQRLERFNQCCEMLSYKWLKLGDILFQVWNVPIGNIDEKIVSAEEIECVKWLEKMIERGVIETSAMWYSGQKHLDQKTARLVAFYSPRFFHRVAVSLLSYDFRENSSSISCGTSRSVLLSWAAGCFSNPEKYDTTTEKNIQFMKKICEDFPLPDVFIAKIPNAIVVNSMDRDVILKQWQRHCVHCQGLGRLCTCKDGCPRKQNSKCKSPA
jgi:hypothetical protein